MGEDHECERIFPGQSCIIWGRGGTTVILRSATLKRLLWFVGLWAAGVGVTALVGFGIKLWLK